MREPDRNTLFLVEDDEELADLISYNLEREGFKVRLFTRAMDFFGYIEKETPSLILLDVMLPDIEGFRIAKFLQNRPDLRDIPIIFLTAKGSEEDKLKGFELGADDYITKPFSMRELVSRVKAVLKRAIGSRTTETYSIGGLSLDANRVKVVVDGQEVKLTPAEFKILKILLDHYGKPVSRDYVVQELWGIDKDTTERAIDVHIKHIRDKLGSYGSFIKTVRGFGYKFEV